MLSREQKEDIADEIRGHKNNLASFDALAEAIANYEANPNQAPNDGEDTLEDDQEMPAPEQEKKSASDQLFDEYFEPLKRKKGGIADSKGVAKDPSDQKREVGGEF